MSYYSSRLISNSSLSYINPDQEGSAQKFRKYLDGELESEDSLSLERGDLIHKYMLEPDKFNALEMDLPSDTIIKIVDEVLIRNYDIKPEFGDNKEFILAAADTIGYGKNWKPETVLNKIVEAGTEYYNFKLANSNKIIVDYSTMNVVRSCVASLMHSDPAMQLLNAPGGQNEKEIFWDAIASDGSIHKAKSKLDRLIIDHVAKTFTVVDLKTSGKHISRYPESFAFWHTYRQMAYYIDAIQFMLGEEYSPSQEHYIVAVMTKDPYLTRVFRVTMEGGYIDKGRQEYKDLLTRINVHTTSANWVDEMETINGVLTFELKLDE